MPTDPTHDLPAVEFAADEPLIHQATCKPPWWPPHKIRLYYTDGRVVCLDCGAWVPGEVREMARDQHKEP